MYFWEFVFLNKSRLSRQEKTIALERAAFDRFVSLYMNDVNVKIKFLRVGTPPEPDIVCLKGGFEIGIEIAHLFRSERDARRLLDRPTEKDIHRNERIREAKVPLSVALPARLNLLLSDKASKDYSFSTWLVIRNANPLWQKEDFQLYRDRINIPDKHPFVEIWLVCDQKGYSGILRLHP